MWDCDLCNTSYGIGQLLSMHPIILFSGIVASIYTAAFLLRLIGCCCFLCTKENVRPVQHVLAVDAVIDVPMPRGNIFLFFPRDLTVKKTKHRIRTLATRSNNFKAVVAH